MDNRWVINRAGLVNFWYYDEETFDFSQGRLLLRGSNGSGKSVTMQSFIPLLLDGNKSPERLDPFGSKARKIENYILGDDENGKDESIGYLFMEFKKKHSNNRATIGMGFKANRGKPMKSWGFSITDGRRIGEDFFLYKQMGEKIPLTRKELENRIGDGGQVVEGQKNYMKLVNDLVFGFDDLDEYDELVKLLVQLRSPKLSKDFKPTVIYEIMENSLQPLSEDDLRPMSEAIENMDNIKSRLEVLKDCKGAADRIRQAFDRYNQFIVLDKARQFYDHHLRLEQQKNLKNKKTREIDKAGKEIASLKEKIIKLEIVLQTQQEKKRELESHDSVKIREKIMQTEKEIQELATQRFEKDNQHETKRQQERDLDNQVSGYRQNIEAGERGIIKQLTEMDDLAETFVFDEHDFMRDEVKKDVTEPFDFGYVTTILKKHTEILSQAVKALEKEKQISEAYEKCVMELDLLKKELAEKERLREQANRQMTEIQDEMLEKLYQKNQDNQEYIISVDGLSQLARVIRQFGPESNFNDIAQILRGEQIGLEELKRERLFIEQSEWAKINKEKSEKQAELDYWKKMKDPEPARAEKVKKNREKLVALGIPHIPLYKALDYVDGVDAATQAAIEEAMADMGILDALIIPETFRGQLGSMPELSGDKYIFPAPQFMVHSMNQYLQVETSLAEISPEEVANVLTSILIDENHHTHMDEKGNYSLGILRGKASGRDTPKFIGSSARKKYREEQQKALELELAAITDRLIGQEKVLNQVKQEIEILKREFTEGLNQEDLVTAANVVKQAMFEHVMVSKAVAKKSGEEKILYEAVKKIKEEIYRITGRITLPVNLETYEEAQIAATTYLDELHKLEKQKLHLDNFQISLRGAENRYEEVLQEIDDVLYEISGLNTKRATLALILTNLSEQLKLTDYEAIKAELEQCLLALKELPQEKEETVIQLERVRLGSERLTEDIGNLEQTLKQHEKIYSIMKEAFKEELQLGYAVKSVKDDLFSVAGDLLAKNPVRDKQNKDQVTTRIVENLNSNSQYLRDFSVNSQYIFEKEWSEDEDEAVEKAHEIRRRLNITAKVTGKVVNFYDLSDYLKDSLEETEKLLRESDRELFEDILVKNISKKISARIFHSEKWVDNMNQLMAKMDTSMGLSFSLRWTNKKAETEEQLDTRKLVNLLKMDGNLLRDEDLNALSEHFRSKITLARRALEEKDVNLTFHSIVKDILDYRKWFEFKLFFKKTGHLSKELTNNGFFKFSGGEKAMAMYVPLFSAVNARYEAAGKESARILSLDEAFAGVDEQNIRDMFRLLNDLDLSYIINSQILWGDYDTVDSLAISELIRPDNADFVTVLRYHWNGKVRKLVVDDAS
ncbi:TIGR02680 family protein [Acetobacterium bakii]|uniref:TIGR02680 family protein n=1 Tax=Acetobacterium bakii TaxID=52689 RepID=A0A0L6U5Q1_9FIRM|nr:TIGR02680 family protein [Acetobacterium bakii]KNZ43140.1 hypothetical protein AKG39_03065 [Acetobacterium bakii]